MPSFKHKQTCDYLRRLDTPPDRDQDFNSWITGANHLNFIERDSQGAELLIHAHGSCTTILSAVITNTRLSSIDRANKMDLSDWAAGPQSYIASYMLSHDGSPPWIEYNQYSWGAKILADAYPLVFLRRFEGSTRASRDYLEIRQDYLHITDSHWMKEENAYCRFDELGDLDHIISVTQPSNGDPLALVTFKRDSLDKYLTASDSALVRLFDFELHKEGEYPSWDKGDVTTVDDRPDFFYRQNVIAACASHAHGIQIVSPGPSHHIPCAPIDFIALDCRNGVVTNISTDPSATTSYFVADQNNLPFDTSPVFFRPDILQKYRGDRDKYTVSSERITCRGGWSVRYDISESGQVHASINRLRGIPYSEQIYWKSFNEEPKSRISKRAYIQDFKGEPFFEHTPFEEVSATVNKWRDQQYAWWKSGDVRLMSHDMTPRSHSRDEWALSFLDLASLIIDGFQTKTIRATLIELDVQIGKDDKSLSLLEKLIAKLHHTADSPRLSGLREVQAIRSKGAAHRRGRDFEQMFQNARKCHESLTDHFNHVCQIVAKELRTIECVFGTIEDK